MPKQEDFFLKLLVAQLLTLPLTFPFLGSIDFSLQREVYPNGQRTGLPIVEVKEKRFTQAMYLIILYT